MEKIVPLKIKTRNIAIGFFGWIIFHSLLFIFWFFYGIDTLEGLFIPLFKGFDAFWLLPATVWLSAIIAPIVLFAKKRIWVGAGIVAAFIINTGIWIFLFPSGTLGAFPFPLGLLLGIGN